MLQVCAAIDSNALLVQRFPADQRNGDGEAKCPAGRARVCPTVLHPPQPGSRLPAQVGSASNELRFCFGFSSIQQLVVFSRFYGKNSSYVHGGLDGNGKPVEAVYGQSVSPPPPLPPR